jgi:hypothetical protein
MNLVLNYNHTIKCPIILIEKTKFEWFTEKFIKKYEFPVNHSQNLENFIEYSLQELLAEL